MKTVLRDHCLVLLLMLSSSLAHGATDVPCSSVATLSPALARVVVDLVGQEAARVRLLGVSAYSPIPSDWKLPEIASAGRLDAEKILALRPACVFFAPGVLPADSIERFRANVLKAAHPIRVLEVPSDSLSAVSESYRLAGKWLGASERGEALAVEFSERLLSLKGKLRGLRAVIQVDSEPLVVLGGGRSFLSDAFEHLGVENVLSHVKEAYPRISRESVLASRPDRIWILGEPENAQRYEAMAREWRTRFPELNTVRRGGVRTLLSRDLTLPTLALIEALEKVVRDESR